MENGKSENLMIFEEFMKNWFSLKTIEENTHLGAGYNISNMDLEIRGG